MFNQRRRIIGAGIGLCLVGMIVFWYFQASRIQDYYPLYPHATQHTFHAEPQTKHGVTIPAWLEFHSQDSPESIKAWYQTTLLEDRWIVRKARPTRLVFERPSRKLDGVETITLTLEATSQGTQGVVWYRLEDWPCKPPTYC